MKKFFFTSSVGYGAVAALVFALCASAVAGPGAHGPDGEHLGGTAANTASASAQPRIETKSELFELVGYLGGGELSVMINRFETNEAVLNAKVEVSTGSSKAAAQFHADHGDYAVDNPAFLKVLAAPGEHALIFTVIAGTDSDLLEGSLAVTPAQAQGHAAGHSHALEYGLIAAVGAVVVLGIAVLWRRRGRNRMSYAGSEGPS